jgi:hypothetical protein
MKRKVRFLKDYEDFKKDQIVELDKERADRLLISMIVAPVL